MSARGVRGIREERAGGARRQTGRRGRPGQLDQGSKLGQFGQPGDADQHGQLAQPDLPGRIGQAGQIRQPAQPRQFAQPAHCRATPVRWHAARSGCLPLAQRRCPRVPRAGRASFRQASPPLARQPLHTGWRALGSLRLACLGGIARLDGLGGLLLDSPRERIGDARDEREEREAWWLYLSTHRRLAALGCH